MAACSTQSALALDPRYPDWPCQQLKVPGISIANVWTGPAIEPTDTAKPVEGKDAVRGPLRDAQQPARSGDERDRALFAQAEGDGREHTRGSPEAAGHAGQGSGQGQCRSSAERGAHKPACV